MSARFKRGEYGTSEIYDRFLRYDETPKTIVINDFSGGMQTNEHIRRDKTIKWILNMETDGAALSSISVPKTVDADISFADGYVQNSRYAGGVWLFRKGKTLYAWKNDVFSLVGTQGMLSEEQGEIYDFHQGFCVIDGETIYLVDHDLNVTVSEQYIPTCFTGLLRDGLIYTKKEEPNPFCRYFDVILGEEESGKQTIPADWAVDPEFVKVWKPDGTELYFSYYTFDGETLSFSGYSGSNFRVRFRLLDSNEDKTFSFSNLGKIRDIFAKPRTVIPVSASNDSTMYLTCFGNEVIAMRISQKEGFSNISESNLSRLNCFEEVTGLIAYSDGYLVFFENSVKKLLTLENENGEIVFSLLPFKSDFGSDMPKSICSFDNKILFASTKGGIFYIDKFGISEKDASRAISANIENGEYGFFSHSEEEYKKAEGFCAFGKYYLTVGAITYIWDYRAKLPSGTNNYEDEGKMVWTMTDMIGAEKYLLFLGGKLYFCERETGNICYLQRGRKESDIITSKVQTQRLDFGTVDKKVITEIGIRYCSSDKLTVRPIFDGEQDSVVYTLPQNKSKETVYIRPYGKRISDFAILLETSGTLCLEALIFRYIC